MFETVKNLNKNLAFIIRNNFRDEDIKFFTPDDFSQQLGYMNRPKGTQYHHMYIMQFQEKYNSLKKYYSSNQEN